MNAEDQSQWESSMNANNPMMDRFFESVANYTPLSDDALRLKQQEVEATKVFHESRFVRSHVCDYLATLYEYMPLNQTSLSLHSLQVPTEPTHSEIWHLRASGVLLLQTFMSPFLPQLDIYKALLLFFDLNNTTTTYRRSIKQEEIIQQSAHSLVIRLNSTPEFDDNYRLKLNENNDNSTNNNSAAATPSSASAVVASSAAAPALSISQCRSNQIIGIHIPNEKAAKEFFDAITDYMQRQLSTQNRDPKERASAEKAEHKRSELWWKSLSKNSISTPNSCRRLIHLDGDEGNLLGHYTSDAL